MLTASFKLRGHANLTILGLHVTLQNKHPMIRILSLKFDFRC